MSSFLQDVKMENGADTAGVGACMTRCVQGALDSGCWCARCFGGAWGAPAGCRVVSWVVVTAEQLAR